MRRAGARRGSRSMPAVPAGAVRAPYPEFIEPCLATAGDEVPKKGAWLHEIKHDGYRSQGRLRAGEARILTRRGYDWTERFAPIAEALEHLSARELIVDGEIVAAEPG